MSARFVLAVTVALEWNGAAPESKQAAQAPATGKELRARKPAGHGNH